MADNIYCVKCRSKTGNATKPVKRTTSNGRSMIQTTCKTCGTKKSQFVKK